MPDGHPEEARISCKRCRGDEDNAARVRRTDRYRRRRVKGFVLMEWRVDDDVDVQSDWHASADHVSFVPWYHYRHLLKGRRGSPKSERRWGGGGLLLGVDRNWGLARVTEAILERKSR